MHLGHPGYLRHVPSEPAAPKQTLQPDEIATGLRNLKKSYQNRTVLAQCCAQINVTGFPTTYFHNSLPSAQAPGCLCQAAMHGDCTVYIYHCCCRRVHLLQLWDSVSHQDSLVEQRNEGRLKALHGRAEVNAAAV